MEKSKNLLIEGR